MMMRIMAEQFKGGRSIGRNALDKQKSNNQPMQKRKAGGKYKRAAPSSAIHFTEHSALSYQRAHRKV